MYILTNNQLDFTDLILLNSGIQQPLSHHSYGPVVFDHYVLQYVRSGSGTYVINDKQYTVSEGDLFVLFPLCVSYYYADKDNPYCYNWVGIRGTRVKQLLKIAGITPENPVVKILDKKVTDIMQDIYQGIPGEGVGAEVKRQSLIFSLLECIINKNLDNKRTVKQTNEHVLKAIEYIEKNYIYYINVQSICKYLNLNRNYFSALFKREIGVTLIKYLIDFRIGKARYLLKNTNLSVTQISELTGFLDSVSFSIRFKDIEGISPVNYRKKKAQMLKG